MSVHYIVNEKEKYTFAHKENIVILAPNLYWYKKSPIAVKNIKKAYSLAPSILKDRPSKFSEIKIIKNGGEFQFFAYDKQTVSNIIKELNIKAPRVYFAQSTFENIAKPIKVSEQRSIICMNHTVVQTLFKSHESADYQNLESFISDFKFLKNYFFISAKDSSSQKEKRTIENLYLSILVVSLVSLGVELYGNYTEKQNIQKQISKVDFDGKNIYVVKSLISKWDSFESTKNARNESLKELQKSGKKPSTISFEDK